MELFFVSSNQHKIREFQEIFAQSPIEIKLITLLDHPTWQIEVAETGHTYEENALLKTQAYRPFTNLPIIADDSGVEAAALPGLLGVHSARWVDGDDRDRLLALLDQLKNKSDRRLSYHCTICLSQVKQKPLFFSGTWSGTAALVPSGEQGFGYDPIFIPNGFEKTFSELGDDVKNSLSHRRQAIDKLLAYLALQNSLVTD